MGGHHAEEPVASLAAQAPTDAAIRADEREALDWFGGQWRLSLYYHAPIYCDDDDQAKEWRVDDVSGPINDREWDTVGRGETPISAILNAYSASRSRGDA